MIFGKIDYLNLLPFHVFLKRYPMSSAERKAIEHKKGVPSKLCRDLNSARVGAAVISSVESRRAKYRKLDFGICARERVISVLVRKGTPRQLDPASMSSNMLSKILGLEGEVVIGDNALRAYLKDGREAFYDLGEEWKKRTGLPFVFGRFSCVRGAKYFGRLVSKFHRAPVKIPRYILSEYSRSRGVSESDILWYLQFISYKMGAKEKLALSIFLSRARALRFDPN